jgi:hypothetical protein
MFDHQRGDGSGLGACSDLDHNPPGVWAWSVRIAPVATTVVAVVLGGQHGSVDTR